jgi:hypothetical protein
MNHIEHRYRVGALCVYNRFVYVVIVGGSSNSARVLLADMGCRHEPREHALKHTLCTERDVRVP